MMTDDLIPIIHKFPNGQDVTVYPIADLHVGSPQFDSKRWCAFREKLLAESHSRIVIAGDMLNNGIKSSVSNSYEDTMRPSEQKRWLAEQLEPIKDRILCGCGGNHENRSVKETDDNPLYDVFCKLDIEHLFRENACFLIMRFGNDRKQAGSTRPCYATYVTHGSGGGMYIGTGGNKAERFGSVIDGLDCLVFGHLHKPLTFPVGKLVIDKHNNNIIPQQFRVVEATSWLRYGGYAIKKMLTPTAFLLHEIIYSSDTKLVRVIA